MLKFRLAALVVACLWAVSPSVAAEPQQVFDSFLASLKESPAEPAAVERAQRAATSTWSDSRGQAEAITAGLREIDPEFDAALIALGQQRMAEASGKFSQLARRSDPFLAAEATYFLARLHVMRQDYEQAAPLLAELRGKRAAHSLRGGEALYLLGMAHAQMLHPQEAGKALQEFLERYPEAPRRWRFTAQAKLAALARQSGALGNVRDKMNYSSRRLALHDPGEQTVKQQQEIVDLLSKLIKEAEERECKQCSGGGSGQAQNQGQGKGQGQGGKQGGPGNQPGKSQPPGEIAGDARRSVRGGAQSDFGALRDRRREKVFSALEAKFPGRYRQLIEQYYRSLEREPREH